MTRLLTLSEWLCGTDAKSTVFEPLVADWDREWREAGDQELRRISNP